MSSYSAPLRDIRFALFDVLDVRATFYVNTGDAVNTGDEPVTLTAVRPACGCTAPSYSTDAVAPGGQGQITVEYNSQGRPGPFNKSISVEADGAEPQHVTLYIAGTVVPVNIQNGDAQGNVVFDADGDLVRAGLVEAGDEDQLAGLRVDRGPLRGLDEGERQRIAVGVRRPVPEAEDRALRHGGVREGVRKDGQGVRRLRRDDAVDEARGEDQVLRVGEARTARYEVEVGTPGRLERKHEGEEGAVGADGRCGARRAGGALRPAPFPCRGEGRGGGRLPR